MNKELLILLTKFPTPGAVKTRIGSKVGDEQAAQIHRKLVHHCIDKTRSDRWDFQIHFDGGSEGEMTEWLGKHTFLPQSPGNLGARISSAFNSGLSQGYKRICLIGSDIPALTSQQIAQSFSSLDLADLSLGPTEDGGYYLVALKAAHPVLFKNMPWSTDGLFEQTLQTAQDNNLAVHVGDLLEDVDQLEDWQRLSPLLG